MVVVENTQSLNLIKDQLDESLRLAEVGLEQYLEETGGDAALQDAREHVAQLTGVLKLIELKGAADYAAELVDLIDAILAGTVKDRDHALGTLSGSLMILGKYFEHAHSTGRSLPVLLVPTINEVRTLLKKPLIPETCYCHPIPVPDFGGEGRVADLSGLKESGRRLRHMYQVGMLGLLRNENPVINAHIMENALTRLQALLGDGAAGNVLTLAHAMIESIGAEQLTINTPRKSLLGKVDRFVRDVLVNAAPSDLAPQTGVLEELLFAIGLTTHPGPLAHRVIEKLGLEHDRLTDAELVSRREQMFGPGGAVMRSVVDALREEISTLKEQLDLVARGTHEEDVFPRMADAIHRIGNTLQMLGLHDVAHCVKKNDKIALWQYSGLTADSPEFIAVADALLGAEQEIMALLPRIGTTDSSGQVVTVSQLDDARRVVVVETRSGLALAKRAIASFAESGTDELHLANVPTTLNGIWGGLIFLQMERAANIIRGTEAFISAALIRPHHQPVAMRILETLADALTSVDYYLESIEDNKPIGESILEVAEEGLEELGFPVKVAP